MQKVADVDKEIVQKLKDINRYETNLILPAVNNYFKSIQGIMSYLVTKKGMGGVYVSATRPSKAIMSRLGSEINLDDVFFVDAVSYMVEGVPPPSGNVIFVESPTMLEMMMTKTEVQLKKVKSANKFVLFDSINALAVYNNENILSEFIHVLVNNLSGKEIYSFILSVSEQTSEKISSMLKMVCDNTVELGGE